jgi:hypothetical protein
MDVSRNRKEFFELRENALVKRNKLKNEEEGDPSDFE